MFRSMRISLMAAAAMIVLPCAGVSAEDAKPPKLDDTPKRISYSLGYQIGGDFKRQGVEMNAEAVVMGIEDAMSGADPKIPRKAMYELLANLKRKVVEDERKRLGQASSSRERELEYIAEGKAFMEKNAEKPGVKTTKSGLQYKILEPGTGKQPGPTDKVTVNYRGTLVNGNEFDSSFKRGEPATFALNGVIKAWTEGLQLIKEGGKIQLFVPPSLAYGGRGPLAHRTLVFDIDLITVGDGPVSEQGAQAQEGKQ